MSESTFTPPGPIRGTFVYVSWQTRKALSYLAGAATDPDMSTVDGIAEKVLSDWLIENHAGVTSFIAAREKQEIEFKKGLKTKPAEFPHLKPTTTPLVKAP